MATLGSQAVGSIVKLNVNGAAKNFIVVHQGLPGTMYDSSCNGTWLLMEDIYETRAFGGSKYYNESGICSYLNDTFVNLFDSDIKDAIKQVKIPCDTRNGLDVVSAKVFLLSHREVDFANTSTATVEGFELSYFDGGGNTKRIAKFNGTASTWWTRTRYQYYNSNTLFNVDTDGTAYTKFTSSATSGVRPALVLPSTSEVNDDGTITVIGVSGINGELNINGVVYELTGEGYVNVNGVLCEIVDSYVDIDGVLKSLSGGTDRVKLPDGYTQVEYIQSSGTQYINTAFTADSGTKVVMDCELTYPSEWVMIMGSYDSGAYFSWWSKDSVLYAYYGSSNQNMTGSSGRATLDADKNVWSAGGASLTFTASSFSASSSLYLFSISNGGDYALGVMKLYSCQIYDNGTLIRDFIPCTNASGEAGLWDMVNGVFYGNSGTGAFTTG